MTMRPQVDTTPLSGGGSGGEPAAPLAPTEEVVGRVAFTQTTTPGWWWVWLYHSPFCRPVRIGTVRRSTALAGRGWQAFTLGEEQSPNRSSVQGPVQGSDQEVGPVSWWRGLAAQYLTAHWLTGTERIT